MKDIFRMIAKYLSKTPQHSIISSMRSSVSRATVQKFLGKLVKVIPETDFSTNKMGVLGKVIQADETILNFKCKSQRGRSPDNRTDALVIVEVNNRFVVRVFARIIPDKCATTMLPIICSQVLSGSVIHTDEHRSYGQLVGLGFVHDTVCHKYTFIYPVTGTHTQSVESINNQIKCGIKSRKGVKTISKADYLKEYCFFFNNKTNLVDNFLNILK